MVVVDDGSIIIMDSSISSTNVSSKDAVVSYVSMALSATSSVAVVYSPHKSSGLKTSSSSTKRSSKSSVLVIVISVE